MARLVYDPNDESQEPPPNNAVHIDPQLQNESRELYNNFLREEIQLHGGLEMPSEIIPPSGMNVPFSNPLWLCNASNLRQIANEFSNSPLREAVRSRAQSVDLATLNSQTFGEMIQEVFSGGNMTRERVLVVFFFCSDLALFALQSQALNIFHQLMQWSTGFITGRLSQFISSQGGWASVLNNSMNMLLKISATATCVVAVFAMLVFIRKNWN